jgi:FixJ family two-component response regulator
MTEVCKPNSSGPYAVAVLDDDKPLSLAICRVFKACGLGAEAFCTVDEFTAAVDGQRYDAFVLDWRLAGLTARAVIQHLRATLYPSSPIFLYTGQLAVSDVPMEPEVAATLAEHQVEFRQKPYSHRALALEIRRALEPGAR